MSKERRTRGSLYSRLALAFIACVAAWAALLYVVSERSDRRDGTRGAPDATGVRHGVPEDGSGDGRVRVSALLDGQPVLAALSRVEPSDRVHRAPGSGVAGQAGSGGSPTAGATWPADLERRRERALKAAARRSAPAARRARGPVVERLARLGGRIEAQSSLPNRIVVSLPPASLGAARAIAGVASVEPADSPAPLAIAPDEDAAAWHVEGCLGSGLFDYLCPAAPGSTATTATPGAPGAVNSADGLGGPDVAVIDTGVNLFHSAWGGRSPRVVTPPRRAVAGGAANPCPSSPVVDGMWCGYGTVHANAVAAIVGSRDPAHRGVAPGVDKLLDPLNAISPDDWLGGVAAGGEAPAGDLPEVVVNALGQSSGATEAPGERIADMFVSTLGVARSAAAGNEGPGVLGVAGQKRVQSPCVAYNTLCMGGSMTGAAGFADDAVAGYSSVGPSITGRKKPDLLAEGAAGCPSDTDAGQWLSAPACGEGTSFAAARGAGAQALLASAGVTDTSAQRALLINSAHMLPSAHDRVAGTAPAQYWTPDGAWGQLDLDRAFAKRANYALGDITAMSGATAAPGPNAARFYRVDDLVAGERLTLAWNRGVRTDLTGLTMRTLTDLDLRLYLPAGDTTDGVDNDDDIACAASGTPVAQCGADAHEPSETLGYRGVPGDARDNVEQVRAASTGTSIVKVRAASGIESAVSEDYAVAGDRPLIPLATPTLTISRPVLSDDSIQSGHAITVSATVTNDSVGADLEQGVALHAVTASLVAPGGSGVTPLLTAPPTLAPGETAQLTWLVNPTGEGVRSLRVEAYGKRFGEQFGGSSAARALVVDDGAPAVTLNTPSSWLQSRFAAVDWRAADPMTDVTSVEIQSSVNGDAFKPYISNGAAHGNATPAAEEGQTVRLRARATDAAGNVSEFVESPSWTVDAEPPTIVVQAPTGVPYGAPVAATIRAHNIGAPVTAYVRTSSSRPFLPLDGTVFTVPSVARLGRPLKIEAQAVDALNRVARASATVNTRAEPTKLTIKSLRRDGRTLLAATLSRKSSGTLTVTAACKRGKARARVTIRRKSKALVRLGRAKGMCEVRANFTPQATYRFSSVRASKRIRF